VYRGRFASSPTAAVPPPRIHEGKDENTIPLKMPLKFRPSAFAG